MPQTLVPSDNWFWGCLHSNFSTLDNNSKYIDIGTKDSTSLVSTLTANSTRTVSICLTAYAGNLTSNFTFDIFNLFTNLHLTTERKAAYNSTFAIGGASCSADSFVIAESAVLRMNICGEKPAHRQYAARYLQPLPSNRTTIN